MEDQISNYMITLIKEQYTSPKCEELDARLEGVIAASPGPFSGFEEEEDL